MVHEVITCRQFGNYGRFGNCLFQYAFLKCYARRYNLELQLPPWVGNELFGAVDLPVSALLPDKPEQRESGPLSQPLPPQGNEFAGYNFVGYAQYHTSWFWLNRDYIRTLFQVPAGPIHQRVQRAWQLLRRKGTTRIGLHLRRGDYGRLIFYITPVQWYLNWLAKHWERFERPVLFIATESPELVKEFAEYNPMIVEDLGLDLKTTPLSHYSYLHKDQRDRNPRQMDFYPDFRLLSQCEVILAPNSTFSFAAAMLNPFLEELWRSHLPTQTFRKTNPWDSVPLERDHLDNYPNIKGVRLEENPYW